MNSRRAFLTSGLALAMAGALPHAALADSVTDAESFVEVQGNELLGIMGMPRGEPRQDAFRIWVDEAFNLDLVAKLALGPYLQHASPEQLDAYLDAFNEYIIVTYEARFDTFSGYELKILRGRPAGSQDSVVQTLVFLGNDQMNVDFRVRRESEEDLDVIDVTVEGISMLRTQQEEFSSVIQHSGLDGLIDSLRAQAATIAGQEAG